MPIIAQFYGIKISMFYSDHGAPHFHAYYGEYSAKFDIENCSVVSGGLPRRARKLVSLWGLKHKQELKDNWKRALKHEVLHYIEPIQ